MNNNRKDELSLHMRIPADKCYLGNAILTLEGICEHFSVSSTSRDRIVAALEEALKGSIDLSYADAQGLFDLKFSVFKDRLQITVEDFMLGDKATDSGIVMKKPDEEVVRERLKDIETLADGFEVFTESGRNSCYSMQFNLALAE
jgi:anti-sigma regulatory factor (Ser/Thr protein kinase)